MGFPAGVGDEDSGPVTTVEAVSPYWLWTCAFECGPAEPLVSGFRRNDG